MDKDIAAIIGCGRLGMACGEIMAEKYYVKGYDIIPTTSDAIDIKRSVQETILGAKFIFITVDTPHPVAYSGSTVCSHLPPIDFEYSKLERAVDSIKDFVTKDQIVVIVSTVSPGSIRSRIAPKINCDVVYNPYLVAQGTIKEDFINSEIMIMGGDRHAIAKLSDFYAPILSNDVVYTAHTWEEAELLKMSYNTFLSLKITFGNLVNDVCERLDNANSDNIMNSLAHCNKRLFSSKFMRGGMPTGGVCLPRDNIVLSYIAEKCNLPYNMYEDVNKIKEGQANAIAEKIDTFGLPVIMVGCSYKPNLDIDTGSTTYLISQFIKQDVIFYDKNINRPSIKNKDYCYVICHLDDDWGHSIDTISEGSVIFDVWRQIDSNSLGGRHVHRYGDSRLDNGNS